ncbi:MAG: endonuclease/exonuclease/phosphatase family protein [Muribaculaceae bacterium]
MAVQKKISGFNLMCKVAKRLALVLTLLLGLLMLAAAYGGYIDPRISAKPSLLTLALPYVLAVTAAMAALCVVFAQWRMALIALGSIVLSWPSVKVVSPLHIFPPKVKPEQEALLFKVMTFNAKYFIYDESEYWNNNNRAVDYIIDSDADIVAVQEGDVGHYLAQMPSLKERYAVLKSKYPYRTDSRPNNLSLLSRYPITELGGDTLSADNTAMAEYYKVKIKGRELFLVNLHLQSIRLNNDDKSLFLEYTRPGDVRRKFASTDSLKASILSKLQLAFRLRADQADLVRSRISDFGENVIVCGDFNDTPCSYAYRTIRGDDFADVYEQCGFLPTITYHENRFWLKIDHLMYRGAMKAVDVTRADVKVSDHYGLTASFVWNPVDD